MLPTIDHTKMQSTDPLPVTGSAEHVSRLIHQLLESLSLCNVICFLPGNCVSSCVCCECRRTSVRTEAVCGINSNAITITRPVFHTDKVAINPNAFLLSRRWMQNRNESMATSFFSQEVIGSWSTKDNFRICPSSLVANWTTLCVCHPDTFTRNI